MVRHAVIVVFSASWCEPCKVLKREYTRQGIDFEVIDVDSRKGGSLAARHGISLLPTVAARVANDLWEVGRDDASRVKRLAAQAVCDRRTRECRIPETTARRLGLKPFEHGDGDSDPVDLVDVLKAVTTTDRLARMLAPSGRAVPRLKRERAEQVFSHLIAGTLDGRHVAGVLRRDGLGRMASTLGMDADGTVATLRRRLARAFNGFRAVEARTRASRRVRRNSAGPTRTRDGRGSDRPA